MNDIRDIRVYIKDHYDKFRDNELQGKMGEQINTKFTYKELNGREKWVNGFKFVMEHLMMRGRDDDLSYKYINFYILSLNLQENTGIEEIQNKIDILNEFFKKALKDGEKIDTQKGVECDEIAKKFNVNCPKKKNSKDSIKLIMSDICTITGLLCLQKEIFDGPKNIFDYLFQTIKDEGVTKAYEVLHRILYVGDKLASFTLRDIVLINEEITEINFKPYDYLSLFPIDTRVSKKAQEILSELSGFASPEILGITKDLDPLYLKIKLINLCEEQGFTKEDKLAPLKLNAGMWYSSRQEKNREIS